MTRIVPPEEAQRLLDLMPGDREEAEYAVFDRMARYTPCHETYAAAPNLAHTVIIRTNQVTELQKINGYKDRIIAQQEQQITRLKVAVERASDYNPERINTLIKDGIITATDMEP